MTRSALLLCGLALWVGACESATPPAFTFYDNQVAPTLQVGCQQQTTGCHVSDGQGVAAGNLDLSTYDALIRREDVLYATGPYPVGQLLLKGGDPVQIGVQTLDPPDPAQPDQKLLVVSTDIRHAGGSGLRQGADGYAEIKRWIESGYARSGAPRVELAANRGECTPGPGVHPRFDPAADLGNGEAYLAFVNTVQPILTDRCAGSACHGTPVADLHLSCGDTEEERRWNFFITSQHVDAQLVSTSELLRRPLATLRGGVFHEGGDVFEDVEDEDYVALRSWAEELAELAPELTTLETEEEGLRFFANWVQPVLVREGCMFLNCHSPSMFHDLRLRGGSEGLFSPIAIERNYEMARLQLATESPDPNDSRIIAKNLFPRTAGGGDGIAHRGGALFEDLDGPADPSKCEGIVVEDAAGFADVPSYCVLARWHEIEREEAIARGELQPELQQVLYVSRPPGIGDSRDFYTYRPGADLMSNVATVDAQGQLSLGLGATSLLAGCGLQRSTADVRGPAVSWDARRIAFAARSSEQEPLRIYGANPDGSDCAPIAGLAAASTSGNGIDIHDFDPAFSPDGRIVFASTRGVGEGFAYSGPTLTPSQLAPNANLYLYDPADGSVRQLTYLLNQELTPDFMADGRVIMTAEKRELDFFQLAGRRINLDGGDYHPLFAQRDTVGFARATEIIELPNRNLAMIAADREANEGAGNLVVVNRSIGPDQVGRTDDPLYIKSVSTFPTASCAGGQLTAVRSPARLPSREILVSAACGDTGGALDFDLYAVDPLAGTARLAFGEAGRAELEAVAVLARPAVVPFVSRSDEANANTRIEPGATDAQILFQDVPLLASLLFSNTREGRPLDDRIAGLEVLEVLPPPAGTTSFGELGGQAFEDEIGSFYANYESLGWAPLERDGSLRVRVPGGAPILLRLTDLTGQALELPEGLPISGEAIQREQMQFYPGERSNQGFPRRLFNAMCGGCHGSLTGFELDIAVDPDVLTGPSQVLARDAAPAITGR